MENPDADHSNNCHETYKPKKFVPHFDSYIKKLSKSILSFDQLEKKLLHDLNKEFPHNCKTMIEFRDTVMKWCPADGLKDD